MDGTSKITIDPKEIRDDEEIQLPGGEVLTVRCKPDEFHGAPWEECDGHGPVSDWVCRDKRPGEWILSKQRNLRRYYDHAEAMKQAKREGWSIGDEERAALADRLGREPTAGEIREAAVLFDYTYLRDWCNDLWSYCGVVVKLTRDGREIADDSIWGVEDRGDYWRTIAAEMANALLAQLAKEHGERTYWEARDVETVTP